MGSKVVRRILNLAATEWNDEYGMSWLALAPKMRLLPDLDKRLPHPLTWDEQECLFRALPDHLAEMALFAVNTGCRDGEICRLRWDWEVSVPELGTSVFIVPGQLVKNGEDRLIVLNRVARSVVDSVRHRYPAHVFSFRGKPVTRMLNTAWMRARRAVGLSGVRVHDLKHAFGRRLRAAGVSFEDRQDLLGSPFGSHHDPLVSGRALAAHRGGRPGVRASRRAARARGAAPALCRIAHAELTQGTLQKSRKE